MTATAAALTLEPAPRWQIWVALGCAVSIHFVAVVLSQVHPVDIPIVGPSQSDTDVVGIIDLGEQAADQADIQQPQEVTTSEDANEFHDDSAPSTPVRKQMHKPVSPSVVANRTQSGGASPFRLVKTLAINSPRPGYPYEARRQRITGSGMALLTINSGTGAVLNARMSPSTGNQVLDDATIDALHRWRFKPGTVSSVQVPITFTLTGVVY